MIRLFKIVLIVACISGGFTAFAQVTTGSPYSQYGLGNLKGVFLPQYKAMGGISVGLRSIGPVYNNVNPSNPASYSALKLTTFDIGASTGVFQLSRANATQSSFNATLSHIIFGIPVNKASAFSFGLIPYSDLGYKFKSSSKVDTTDVDYIYDGDGGLSKVYFGYGLGIGKHLSIGFNAGYLFGRLEKNSATRFPDDFSALNSRTESSKSISGIIYDLGVQYFTNVSSKVRFTFGYNLTTGSRFESVTDNVITHFRLDPNTLDDLSATDTLFYTKGAKLKITMPVTNSLGFVFEKTGKWLFGADLSMSNWSAYREGGTNPNLQNSYRLAVGGQITPNVNSISNYFSLVDYRLGFKHDKTYINVNNTDIKQTAITFGFGFPLLANRTAFYKINFSSELGQRGTLTNNLVRERFANFNIGFLLNDKWFIRRKLD